uniref:Uncharacterized protein n=1 Tax=Plectus sambesii TaxID=2011161 RepID=A0A914XHQ0_9BILA
MAGVDERRRSKCLTEKQGATAAATGVAQRPSASTSGGEMGQRGQAVNTWSGRSLRLQRGVAGVVVGARAVTQGMVIDLISLPVHLSMTWTPTKANGVAQQLFDPLIRAAPPPSVVATIVLQRRAFGVAAPRKRPDALEINATTLRLLTQSPMLIHHYRRPRTRRRTAANFDCYLRPLLAHRPSKTLPL